MSSCTGEMMAMSEPRDVQVADYVMTDLDHARDSH